MSGDYEPELFAILSRSLSPGDNFLDIGANAGYVSLVVKTLVKGGRVIAVEPIPANLVTIRAMAELNPALPIEVIEAAACAEGGTVRIDVTSNLANARLTGVKWELAKPSSTTIEVSARSLDELVEEADPKVVKIDIEGAEVDLLRASSGPARWGHRPVLVVEYHGVESKALCLSMADVWDYRATVLPSVEYPDLSGLVVLDTLR